jgi:hypothetical protein
MLSATVDGFELLSLRILSPMFAGRDAFEMFERTVKGTNGAIAYIQCNAQNRQVLPQQALRGFVDAVVVQKVIEIAVTQVLVDGLAQLHRAGIQLRGEQG